MKQAMRSFVVTALICAGLVAMVVFEFVFVGVIAIMLFVALWALVYDAMYGRDPGGY